MNKGRVDRWSSPPVIAVIATAFALAAMPVAPASSMLAADPPACVRTSPMVIASSSDPDYYRSLLPIGTHKVIYLQLWNRDSTECGPSRFALAISKRVGSSYILAKVAASTITASPGAAPVRVKVFLTNTAKAKVGSATWFDTTMANLTSGLAYHNSSTFKVTVVP
jgi:hypothetical protein